MLSFTIQTILLLFAVFVAGCAAGCWFGRWRAMNTKSSPGFWQIVGRSCRLRCPVCGEGQLFAGYFKMNQQCAACGEVFQRGPGYYLGAIYFNYGLTSVLITVGYLALFFFTDLSDPARLALLTAAAVLFPLWFFRYARSFWVGFDRYWDPPEVDSNPTDESTG